MCNNKLAQHRVRQLQLVGEGIVAQSTVRFAASAGVVAASLLILGPCPPLALADENESGSQSTDDDRKSGLNVNSNTQIVVAPEPMDDLPAVGGTEKGLTPDLTPPLMELGTAGSDLEDLAIVDSIAPDGPITLRSAAVPEQTPSVNSAGAVPRSGADRVGSQTASAGSPRVVVGNGRSPGLRDRDSEPVRETWAPEVVPPVPVAIEVTAPPPPPPPLPPVERIQPPRLVVEKMVTPKTDTTTDPLFGLAGLILIPAVGAVLGYRQARAAQTLRESALT
jgi:hypothetical protein